MDTQEQLREVGSTTEACGLRSQDTLVPILPLSGWYGGGSCNLSEPPFLLPKKEAHHLRMTVKG